MGRGEKGGETGQAKYRRVGKRSSLQLGWQVSNIKMGCADCIWVSEVQECPEMPDGLGPALDVHACPGQSMWKLCWTKWQWEIFF